MKNKHIIAIIFLLMMPIAIYAQRTDKGSAVIGSAEAQQPKNTYTARTVVVKKDVTQRKPELYHSVIKKNGWYVGLGKITEAEAKKLLYYYRFSNMNKAGNWTFVEAMHNGHYTTDHDLSPYMLPEGNNTGITTFSNSISKICKWDFAYDDSGKNVIVERAYDEQDNLILSFSPVKNGNIVSGTYIDEWGRPVKLSQDMGIISYSQCDENGMEVARYITDVEGHILRNSNGVEVTQYEYDDKHRLIRERYGNATSNFMKDNDGSFGYEYTYDAQNRVATKRQLSNNSTPYLYVYSYENGNLSNITFYDINNKPFADNNGLHRAVYKYDLSGNLIQKSFYGIEGQYVNVRDKYAGESCLRNYKVTPEGFNDNETYRLIDSSLVKNYYLHETKDSLVVFFDGPTYIYTHIRKKGVDGKFEEESYYRDGKPWAPGDRSHYREIYRYTPIEKNKVKYIHEYLDVNEKAVPYGLGYRDEIIIDSIAQTKAVSNYSVSDEVYNRSLVSYPHTFDNKEYVITNRNILGVPAYTNDGHTVYSMKVEHDIYGKENGDLFFNPWGERAYSTSFSEARAAVKRLEGKIYFFDEDMNMITSDKFFMQLPKAVVIEVTDSIAYGINIHDGDIVLKYGDWVVPEDSSSMNIISLYAETALTASHSKTMLLLHSDPISKTTEVREVELPSGSLDELGMYFHPLCLNRNEQARKTEALKSYLATNKLSSLRDLLKIDTLSNDETKKMSIQLIIPKSPASQGLSYSKHKVNSPCFVLYADMVDTAVDDENDKNVGRYWDMSMLQYEGDYTFGRINKGVTDTHRTTLFVVDDKMNVDSIVYMGENESFFYAYEMVTEDIYNKYMEKLNEWYANTAHTKTVFPDGEEPHLVIGGEVMEEEGYPLYDRGYRGEFYLGKVNDWDCTMEANDVTAAFERGREKTKSIVLIPKDSEDYDDDSLVDNTLVLRLPAGAIGFRYGKYLISEDDYNSRILEPYKKTLEKVSQKK